MRSSSRDRSTVLQWALALLFVTLGTFFFNPVDASHFAFGTITYEAPTDANTLVYSMNFAYRYDYSYWSSNRPAVGKTTQVDGNFYHRGSNKYTISIVTEKVYANQNWFYGFATLSVPKTGLTTLTSYYDLCCRIYKLHDGNSGQGLRVYLDLDLTNRWRSPVTIALPRIYLDRGVPMSFKVSSISHDNYPLSHSLAPTSRSELYTAAPCGSYGRGWVYLNNDWTRANFYSSKYNSECVGVTKFSLSTSGVGTWTPQDLGQYAISIAINDGKATVYSDFLFVVETPCAASDTTCNHAPYFSPPLPEVINVYAGTQFSTVFTGVDDDGDDVEFIFMSMYSIEGFSTRTQSVPGRTTMSIEWFAQIDQLSSSVCYQLVDSRGKYSQTSCVLFNLMQANYILVSGTVRDFDSGSYGFGTMASPSTEVSTPLYVNTDLDSQLKPVYKTATGTYVPSSSNFNNWWSNTAAKGVYLYTVILVQYSNPHPSQRVFSLFQKDFYPIDSVSTAVLDSNGHNRYFSYEIHTYFEYLGGETYTFQARDDLLVFINKKIVPNWKLQGMHASNLQQAVTMDSLRASHGLTVGENYQMDLFYVHRSNNADSFFGLEMSNSTNCNAINILQQDSELLAKSWIFQHETIGTGLSSSYSLQGATLKAGYLEVISNTATSSATAAWFAIGDVPERVKILNGFKTEFTFAMASNSNGNPMEGFAFVMQDHSPTARGNEGGGLGYASLTKSIALEFDTATNSAQNDPNYQHISLHTKYAGTNSALEDVSNYPSGSSYVGNIANLPFTFTNGTDHRVRVEVNPGILTFSLRVYLNDNIRPVYSAELDASLMASTFINGAYVGFTASSSSSNPGYVRIKRWNMVVVPALASETGPLAIPTNSIAGQPAYMDVQLRDACKNPLYVSGEASKFQAAFRYKYANNVNSAVTITDRGAGVYRFTYAPQRSGTWNMRITYQALDVAEPISNRDTGYDIEITPTFTSTERSEFVWGAMPVALTNVQLPKVSSTSTLSTVGLGCQAFTPQGLKVTGTGLPSGVSIATKTDYDTWIKVVPQGSIVACALHTQMSSVTDRNAVYSAISGITYTDTTNTASMAAIFEKTGATSTATITNRARAVSNDDIVSIKWTGSKVTYTATSGGLNRVVQGYVQATPEIFSVSAGQNGAFTIISRDIYGNLKTSNEESSYTYSFSPSLGAGLATDMAVANGFFLCTFGTSTSGIYALSVNYGGAPVGTATNLYVNAGAASHITSTAIGAGVGGTVNTPITFQVQLRDAGNNNVIVQPVIEITELKLVKTDGTNTVPVSNLASMWDPVLTIYNIRYTTTVAGQYNVFMYINGQRHVGTSSTVVSISPDVESPKSFVYIDSAFTKPSLTSKVGESYTIFIQARDQFENSRTSPNTVPFTLTVADAASLVSTPTISFLANGIYTFSYVPKVATPITFTVKLGTATIQMKDGSQASWTVQVQPGNVADKSVFSLLTSTTTAANGNKVNFEIVPKDEYGNIIPTLANPNSAFTITANAITSTYFYTSTATIESCTASKCTGFFTNVFKAAEYTVTAVLTSTQQTLVNGATGRFTITPGVTSAPNCLVVGVEQAYTVDTLMTATITDRDAYDNVRTHVSNSEFTCDFTTAGSSTPGATGTSTSSGANTGQYKCSVNVGAALADIAFNFKHSGNLITSIPSKVVSELGAVYAKVFPSVASTTAIEPTASGVSVGTFTAGSPATVVVKSFTTDSYASLNTVTGSLTIEGYNNAIVVSSQSVSSSTGIYSFTWTPTTAQANTGFIVKGTKVSAVHGETPYKYYTYSVTPSKMSAPQSSVTIASTTTAGSIFSFTVTPRDQYSNTITSGTGITLKATLVRENAITPISLAVDCAWASAESLLKCTYPVNTITVAGRYRLELALSGSNVASTTFPITYYVTVAHAAIDPAKTVLSYSSSVANQFSNSNAPVARTPHTLYAFTYDAFGNACTGSFANTAVAKIPSAYLKSSDFTTNNVEFTTKVSSNIFSASVTFNSPSYDGHTVTLAGSTAAAATVYTSQLLKVRSGAVSSSNSFVALTATGTKATSATFTVDSTYELFFHVRDVNNLPWINSLSSITADLGLLSASIRANPDVRTSSTVNPEIANAVDASGKRILGVFKLTLQKGQYGLIGTYNLQTVSANNVALIPAVTDGPIVEVTVTAGSPYADNTVVTALPTNIKTNVVSDLTLFLRDAAGNVVNTSGATVTTRITRGSITCADVNHSDGLPWDSYELANFELYNGADKALAVANQEYSYYKEKSDGTFTEMKSSVYGYKVFFKPLEAGTFTMNVTVGGTSYMSCVVAQTHQLTVVPGNPHPSTTTYWFLGNVPSVGGVPQGIAGTEYTVRVQLKDFYNQNLTISEVDVLLGNDGTAAPRTGGEYDNWVIDDCNAAGTDCTRAQLTKYVDYYKFGYRNGQIDLSFKPFKAGNRVLFLALNSTTPTVDLTYARISPNGPTTFNVIHGTPANVVPGTSPTGKIAGDVLSFTATVTDSYGNPVTSTETHTVKAEVVRVASTFTAAEPPIAVGSYRFSVPVTTRADGTVAFAFTPAWEGMYEVTLVLNSKPKDAREAVVTYAEKKITNIRVDHQTCAAAWIAVNGNANTAEMTAYRCPNGTCVKSYAACTPAPPSTKPFACPATFGASPTILYVDDMSECPCPAGQTRKGSVCLVDADIESISECPQGYSACPSNPLQCRANLADCPAPSVCPPGWFICADGNTCATDIAQCPSTADTCTTAALPFRCPNGACVPTSEDCASPVSCPAGKVRCLTDGSCQASPDQCPSPTQCPAPYVRCASGDCRLAASDCPATITCPVGWVLCESGACAASQSACSVVDNTQLDCPLTQVRCSDGTCAQNSLLCPQKVTCPTDKPVMCPDHTCASNLALCVTPSVCAAGTTTCPDGTCVSGTTCPSGKTCPLTTPVLCPDRTCAASLSDCGEATTCPPALPLRCPDGACRASISDCPSQYVCPSSAPLRCPDNSCAVALDTCPTSTATNSTAADQACPVGYVRCAGGECAVSSLTCPTHVTCPLGTTKCADGRCAAEGQCPTGVVSCSEFGLITCPIASAGISCARSLIDCPVGTACPITAPVKCLDASCASSLTQCPPAPTDNAPESRKPCADGSWTLDTCSTAISCPAATPYKCYDQSCRVSASDCPVAAPCPSSTPYRCSSGNCASRPWECTTPVDGICDPTSSTPVKCPLVDGLSACVAKADECSTPYDDDNTGEKIYCPSGFTRCRDGSCKETASACNDFTCPSSFPFLCSNGECAAKASECPLDNGCYPDTPVKCPGVGSCVKSFIDCPSAACPGGLKACADGSCSTECTRAPNGCSKNQVRCADGTCVSDYAICTSKDNLANSCPGNRPVRCSNGYCAKSSSACPVLDNSFCPAATPVSCADGSCKASADLCKLVLPCTKTGWVRCDDGTCMDASEDVNVCSNHNSCPLVFDPAFPDDVSKATQWVRCKQSEFSVPIIDGLCAPSTAQCYTDNGCPMNNFQTQTRCENGRCVTDPAMCFDNVRAADGCPAGKTKCWNGACADSLAACPALNGCDKAMPFLCPNGVCKSASTACDKVTDTDGKLVFDTKCPAGTSRCADGHCKATCGTLFGCPMHKPVRCADGSCRKYSAEFRAPKFGLTDLSEACEPTVSCPSSAYILCENGACVSNKNDCVAVNYQCTSGQTRCLFNNGSQASFTSKCVNDPKDCETPSCPIALPVLCPNGACVADIINCDTSTDPTKTILTGSGAKSKPDANGVYQVLCYDGSYKNSYSECADWAVENTAEAATGDAASVCSGAICPDGSCLPVNDATLCPAVPACPLNSFRCVDGSCRQSCDGVQARVCAQGEELCIDGRCHPFDKCPHFNGCPALPSFSFMCPSRECAANAAACASAANPDPDALAQILIIDGNIRRAQRSSASVQAYLRDHAVLDAMMQQGIATATKDAIAQAEVLLAAAKTAVNGVNPAQMTFKNLLGDSLKSCSTNCIASVAVNTTSFTYDPSEQIQERLVSPLAANFRVRVYSGLKADITKDVSIYVASVPQSIMANATNKVTYSRVDEFGRTLTYAQSLLSPAFSCSVGAGITEPFNVPITLSSNVDRTTNPKNEDICLARLRRFPDQNYAVWECIYTDEQRKQGGAYAVVADPSITNAAVSSNIISCSDNPGVTGADSVPAVYAFIKAPVQTRQVYKQSLDTFWRDNIIWILLGICGGIIVLGLLGYVITRLTRYSSKLDNIKAEVAVMEQEVDEMEQYGGKAGTKDEEVIMAANPLSIQLADLQRVPREADNAKAREALEQQQTESAERRELIKQLEEETNRNLAQLEAMKTALNAAPAAPSAVPMATFTAAPVAAAPAGPVRSTAPVAAAPAPAPVPAAAPAPAPAARRAYQAPSPGPSPTNGPNSNSSSPSNSGSTRGTVHPRAQHPRASPPSSPSPSNNAMTSPVPQQQPVNTTATANTTQYPPAPKKRMQM